MQMTAHEITPSCGSTTRPRRRRTTTRPIFKNSKVGDISRYGEAGLESRHDGPAMTVEFELEGQKFIALNGGPHFKFNEAVSFQMFCETQAGDRRLLERALRGRRRAVRLAQGQVRRLLADRSRTRCRRC